MILDNILNGHQNGRICDVAYLIYFHLPSEKRSSIIKEMIMGLDFSDFRNCTRGDRELKKSFIKNDWIWGVKLVIYVMLP